MLRSLFGKKEKAKRSSKNNSSKPPLGTDKEKSSGVSKEIESAPQKKLSKKNTVLNDETNLSSHTSSSTNSTNEAQRYHSPEIPPSQNILARETEQDAANQSSTVQNLSLIHI